MAIPKKVLFLNTTLARGGTERNLVLYAEQLKQRGIDVEVWYLYQRDKDYSQRLKEAGIRLRCFDVKGRLDVASYFRVAKALAKSDTELLHIFLPSVGYHYLLSRTFFKLRKPTVYSCGGIEFLLPFEKSMTRNGLGESCFPIIGNSPAVTHFLKSAGVSEDRLRVIPNGHDLSIYETDLDRDTFRENNDLPVDKKLFISVGRLISLKRQRDIILAFAQLTKTRNDIALAFVGDGDSKGDLQQQTDQLGINALVRFLGLRSDVSDCLRASDIFVFATESEGLPNALIEACLAGLPVVATNIDPNLAVVKDEESALLVPVGSPEKIELQLAKLLDNENLRNRIASTAQQHAKEKFSIDRCMTLLLEAYSDSIEFFS